MNNGDSNYQSPATDGSDGIRTFLPWMKWMHDAPFKNWRTLTYLRGPPVLTIDQVEYLKYDT
jgi:hypothetical protein